MSPRVTALLLSLVLVSAARVALADDPFRGSVPAASCMPTRATINAGKFLTSSGGYVRFKNGTYGALEFTCRVSLPYPASGARYVYMHYANDVDGSGSGNYVRMSVRRKHKVTGAISSVVTPVGAPKCDGLYSDSTGVDQKICRFLVSDDNYYYFATVRFYRSSMFASEASPTFYGIRMELGHM